LQGPAVLHGEPLEDDEVEDETEGVVEILHEEAEGEDDQRTSPFRADGPEVACVCVCCVCVCTCVCMC
jgi:hypothetical protein